MLISYFVVLWVWLLGIRADLYQVQQTYGVFTIYLYYDDARLQATGTPRYMLTDVNFTSYEITIVEVWGNSTSPSLECRQISQQRVVYGPNGCSNIENPSAALQSANCITNDIEIQLRQAILQQVWRYSKNSRECYLGGGNGDIRLCAGPLRLAIENRNNYLPNQQYTVKDFLASRMQFIECLTGPYAMSPCVVEIYMPTPGFVINTDCSEPITGYSYNGTYVSVSTDPYPDMITTVWKDFEGPNEELRMFLIRDTTVSYEFVICLGTTVAAGNNFTYDFCSDPISPVVGSPAFFLNWVELIPEGTVIPVYNTSTDANDCNISSIVFPSDDAIQYSLLAPPATTSANYSWTTGLPRYYTEEVCGKKSCTLTVTGELSNPYCPEGDLAGGDVVYVYPEYPQLPIGVSPDPTLDYDFDCDKFYPPAATFLNYDGVEIPRISIAQERCFSPFLDNGRITLEIFPYEREIQCLKMGGYTVGRAKSSCGRDITRIFCKKSWIYFDGNCYYKFDPIQESRFSVVLDQASVACTNLNPYAQNLVEIDSYQAAWLLGWFLHWKKNALNQASYRIPRFGESTCTCYSTETFTEEECPCYELKTLADNPIFPICYYPITVSALEPKYAYTAVSLGTALLWTRGQVGPKPNGFEAQCRCFDGWAGKNCETPTCPGSTILLQNPADLNTYLSFFRNCIIFGRGQCSTGNSRICQCLPGFGPSASILTSLETLYRFKDIPCNCPASSALGGTFEINSVIYTDVVDAVYLPCSGVDQGACYTQNSTAPGVCICRLRPNLLVAGGEEPTFQGAGCQCIVPVQPYLGISQSGPIVVGFCNNHGTCCATGQTVDNPFVGDQTNAACYTRTGQPKDGCVCLNPYIGTSCTCTEPLDYALGKIQQYFKSDTSRVYISFEATYFVRYLALTDCALDTPATVPVWLSNEVGKDSDSLLCAYSYSANDIDYYDCGESELAWEFVFVDGVGDPVNCEIRATRYNFTMCGESERVNAYSGRFFDIPPYRDNQATILPQYANFSTHGCTNTACMCNSNWTGPSCAIGVSSIRPTTILVDGEEQIVFAKRVCGEDISLPSLLNSVQGRGQPSYEDPPGCRCNPISSVDPSGSLGPVVERFTNSSCDCAIVFNEDYHEGMLCAHHGDCIPASFPLGTCEQDIIDYEADPLSEPFVEVTDAIDVVVPVYLEEDAFIIREQNWQTISPTRAPTQNPTASPTTVSPTRNPTTKSPTGSPTGLAYIFYVTDVALKGGSWGSYTSAAASYCAVNSNRPASCFTSSEFILLDYSTRRMTAIPADIGYSASLPVLGPTGYLFANSFTDAVTNQNILATAVTASIASLTNQFFWTGYGEGATPGGTGGNCFDWSVLAGDGDIRGRVDSTVDWLSQTVFATSCDGTPNYALCGCVAAPTASPTTRSPTAPASYTATGIALYRSVLTYNGNMGSETTTEAICAADAITQGVTDCLVADAYFGLLTYTSRAITAIPAQYGFDGATLPLQGPTGTTIATTWDTAFNGGAGCPLTNTLIAAGVVTIGEPVYWTGSSIEQCTDWTGVGTGERGAGYLSNCGWVADASVACSATMPFICGCIVAVAPTSSPTTSFPTESPTFVPTQAPTTSPSMRLPGRVMYRIPAGQQIEVERIIDNVVYKPPANVPPFNMSLRVPDVSLEPTVWVDLVLRILDPETNVTSTVAWAGPCNPINPAVPPGSLTVLQDDGVYACPATIKCALTEDCTDDLAPRASAYDGALVFPDMRACWCSYDIAAYPGLPNVDLSGAFETVQLWSGNMTVVNPQPPASNLFGVIHCNNFIDREINCQFQRQSVAYQAACLDWPVGCYSQTRGRFFGGFYTANPKFQYPTNHSLWGYDQYYGIASVLNFQVYLTDSSPDAEYVDPLTIRLMNEYYWINLTSGGIIESTITALCEGYSYQTYVIQGDPGIYFANSQPPPVLNFGASPLLVGDFDAVPVADCIAEILDAISGSPGPLPYDSTCYDYTWANFTTDAAQFRRSGVEYYFSMQENQALISVTLQFNTTFTNLTGVEVYNSHGELCAGRYSTEWTTTDSYVFVCLTTPSANITSGAPFVVRLLGFASLWDQPEYDLTNQYLAPVYDPLATLVDQGYVFDAFRNLSMLLIGIYWDWFNQELPSYPSGSLSRWPTRLRVDPTGLFGGFTGEAWSRYTPFTVTKNVTVLAVNQTFGNQDVRNAWANISEAILNNNSYPYFYALADAVAFHGYYQRPVDFDNPGDLAYLEAEFEAWLSARFCGDNWQCQTFDQVKADYRLGKCIFPEGPFDQRWYQDDPDASYAFRGREGGCRCYRSFERGFFNYPLNCRSCVSGLGPATLEEMSLIMESNNLGTETFDPTALGINPNVLLSFGVPEFEQSFICRFPASADPVLGVRASINFCAGHGLMQNYSETPVESYTTRIYDDTYLIACDRLQVYGADAELLQTFDLDLEKVSAIQGLIYVSGEDILTVIGAPNRFTVYLNGAACAFTCPDPWVRFPRAWTCELTCSGAPLFAEAVCLNEFLLTAPASSIEASLVSLDQFRLVIPNF